MKKSLIIISAAILALMACSKENQSEGFSSLVAYTDAAGIKSHLSVETGVNKVYWDANDAINVFSNAGGVWKSDKFTTTESGPVAKFNGGDVALNENCHALFPYDAAATFNDESCFSTTISTKVQQMTDKTFSPTINLAVGKCNADKEVAFKNAGALLSFTLTQERADTIKYIELKANKGETIAVNGAVSVNWNGGSPAIIPSAEAEKSSVITIQPAGETFKTGETYYVWILPGSYADGITVTLVSPTYMRAEKAGASTLTAGRNQIIPLGDIGGLTYKGSEAEKMTLTFDFSTCPEGWPSGDTEYKSKDHSTKTLPYVLNGVTYNFISAVCLDLASTSNRGIAWGYDGTNVQDYFVSQPERFFGLPAIEGWKLITFKFTQACSTNSSRKVCVTSAITNQTQQSTAYVEGGEPQPVTTQGTEYTYNLSGTLANTVYYFAPTSKGNGFATITLVYEKVD